MPCNQEVVGSEPVGGWTFLLLQSFPTFLYQRSNQVPQEGAVCCVKKMDPQLCCLWQNRLNNLRLEKNKARNNLGWYSIAASKYPVKGN